LHPQRVKIPTSDVLQDAQEKPSADNKNEQDAEDSFEQIWQDELEQMLRQEMLAQNVNNAARLQFEEDRRRNASSKEIGQSSGTNLFSTDRLNLSTEQPSVSTDIPNVSTDMQDAALPSGIFSGAYDDEDVGAEADFNNMDDTIVVSPIPTLKIHKV
ncbi:hypothetical protein Tco_0399368, partial [Tanacetum coccineum]